MDGIDGERELGIFEGDDGNRDAVGTLVDAVKGSRETAVLCCGNVEDKVQLSAS